MSADLGALRWASPAAASAYFEIQQLAPLLCNLLYDPVMPERPLQVLLYWADAATVPESMTAYSLTRLRNVLPAMVTAFIASHTYSLERSADHGRDSDRLVLDDTGSGLVVSRIMMLVTEVIAPQHGDEGRELARASRSELARNLSRIIKMIDSK